jgi:FKBP-type peptidyl-prolyl cis-trans isomerase FkpA
MKRYILLLSLAVVALSSCLKSDPAPQLPPFDAVKQAAIDEDAIKTYLTAHPSIIATKDSLTGLYYQIIKPGEGNNPSGGSTVTVNYIGKLTSDKPFGTETSVAITLSNVIRGWTIGVPLIKPGGSILLIIPSRLGYGNVPNGPIPPNSVLIFNIDLLSIK